MKRRRQYFRKGDTLIYILLVGVFSFFGYQVTRFKATDAANAEIYVNNQLKYVYALQTDEKDMFVPTDIGGVNVKIKDKKIRVTTSNSPLKLNVKQGWIGQPGEVIIGVPDKLIIKVVGKKNERTDDVDFVIK
ncbi:NusG domain II-containing protein [uncultured Cetobacterium sp.]|uniref:NusG domain II-containing protein n=1 Tax=uncultured Cetobacterium sp. TaxID=527638 RepID=UPI0025DA9242|nr:NusG domain II-containing protein [uncultured Cetobacterium sp.]